MRFETVYKRNYPNGSLACHLLGYTASGNVGQGGIEGYYNDYLNGVDGKTYRYMSGSGGVDSETVAAQNGETVVSTIDMNIQKIIEDNITYRLRFGVYPDENGENKWLAGYLSEKPYNQYLTIGEGKTLFQAAFHLKRLLKIKD